MGSLPSCRYLTRGKTREDEAGEETCTSWFGGSGQGCCPPVQGLLSRAPAACIPGCWHLLLLDSTYNSCWQLCS